MNSLGCQEPNLPTERNGRIQPSGSVVTIGIHFSPTAFAVPITLCVNRDSSYALSGTLYVAAVATRCGISHWAI